MATRKTHKARGATFESDIRDKARALGYDAERLARTGAKDEGDVVLKRGTLPHTIIEAKAPGADGKIDLPGWLREASAEVANYRTARGMNEEEAISMVVIKARGKSIEDAYVVQRFGDVFK